jgi:SAM-dependent methyltransferase
MTVLSGHDAPLDYHRRLLDDAARMDAFERALRRVVRPGDVVLDAGAGTGVLALIAARLGAARVHAVESMAVAGVARELARANGLEGRVIVHEADLTRMEPVEPVDVVVSDYLGAFLADDAMLGAVEAAARWLRPGGRIVPDRVTLHLAPLGAVGFPPLDGLRAPRFGVSLAPLLAHAIRRTYRGDFHPHHLLGPAAVYAEYVAPARRAFDEEVRLEIARAGRLRGLCGWFEARLAEGVTLATAPGTETHWGQTFFPCDELAVEAGDTLAARVTWLDEPAEWRWSVRASRAAAPAPRAPSDDASGEGLNARGAAAYGAGRIEEARELWEEAIRILAPRDPACAEVHENLAIAYLDTGRPADAARALLRALDGDPGSREQAARLLVYAFHDAGRGFAYQQALAEYEKAFGEHPIRAQLRARR